MTFVAGLLLGCGGSPAEGECTPYDRFEVYEDADGDGFGAAPLGQSCTLRAGQSRLGSDCDDTEPTTHPDAPDLCDLRDNDCDGLVDEESTQTPFYPDEDRDGFGDPKRLERHCLLPPGWIPTGGDCDDADPDVNPGAIEVCNRGLDDDCDGVADDQDDSLDLTTQSTFFPDLDGDGFGDLSRPEVRCSPNATLVDVGGDCDDEDADVNPDAQEVCDTLDNDCDDLVDDWDPTLDPGENLVSMWADADCDGFGDPKSPVEVCFSTPCLGVDNDLDCDDTDSWANLPQNWYEDADQDGVGTGHPVVFVCIRPEPDGSGNELAPALNGVDCAPKDPEISPITPEVCKDGIDQDCDGADC
ncbi:MAG: putative metal-binding motif-containing protein [Myxococcales bacterium]|nr:putative metal-binding motif-containing protein [Myxococcales bacterium]